MKKTMSRLMAVLMALVLMLSAAVCYAEDTEEEAPEIITATATEAEELITEDEMFIDEEADENEEVVEDEIIEEDVVEEEPVEDEIVEEEVVEEEIIEDEIVEEEVIEEEIIEEEIVEETTEEENEEIIEDVTEEEAEETTEDELVIIEDEQVPLAGPMNMALIEDEIPEDALLLATIIDALDANRHIDIYVYWQGEDIYLGDTVTLAAKAVGYEGVVYSLQWQNSEDNGCWQNIAGANGTSYSFTVTQENYNDYWRVTLNITDVA